MREKELVLETATLYNNMLNMSDGYLSSATRDAFHADLPDLIKDLYSLVSKIGCFNVNKNNRHLEVNGRLLFADSNDRSFFNTFTLDDDDTLRNDLMRLTEDLSMAYYKSLGGVSITDTMDLMKVINKVLAKRTASL